MTPFWFTFHQQVVKHGKVIKFNSELRQHTQTCLNFNAAEYENQANNQYAIHQT